MAEPRDVADEIERLKGEVFAAPVYSCMADGARDILARYVIANADLILAALRSPGLDRDGERMRGAVVLLLPFVDRAAGEGLEWMEDSGSPRMDAADLCIAAARALGGELGDDAYFALVTEGEAAIRALAHEEKAGC